MTATKSETTAGKAKISATEPLKVDIQIAGNMPIDLKLRVLMTIVVTVRADTPYTLNLSTVFGDANTGDTLTYKAEINDGPYVAVAQNYSYTSTVAEHCLRPTMARLIPRTHIKWRGGFCSLTDRFCAALW